MKPERRIIKGVERFGPAPEPPSAQTGGSGDHATLGGGEAERYLEAMGGAVGEADGAAAGLD